MIKNSYRSSCLMILTFISTTCFAQSEEAAIKQTVNTLFEGMKKADTALIRSAFSMEFK